MFGTTAKNNFIPLQLGEVTSTVVEMSDLRDKVNYRLEKRKLFFCATTRRASEKLSIIYGGVIRQLKLATK